MQLQGRKSQAAFYTKALRRRLYSRGNINLAASRFRLGTTAIRRRYSRAAIASKLKLIALPNRSRPTSPTKKTPSARGNFRQRYDDLEQRRAALVERLTALGEGARLHAGYRHSLRLLNDTFRKASLTQRLAVLQAAAWLIDVLEKVSASV
jgi:cell division protein FtsB